MTWEEKIKRIELAPKEVQIMVAKAFLREDIDDENVQYLFNTDTIEELNDPNENLHIENINAEEPEEGIGAGTFSMRVTKPGAGNKNYITVGSGGWNTCIKGNPMDPLCNAYANCVGHASGRFNEIINIIRETTGCAYKTLNCNAENFVERAVAAGLKTGLTPKVGAIMVWKKGSLSSGDGAGHVAVVERVNSNNSVYTSESGWGSQTAFWNQTRTNSNGRWSMPSKYVFRCFIYLPDDVQQIIDTQLNPVLVPTPQPEPIPVPAPTPTPAPVPAPQLTIGTKVKIIGTGNGSSYGTANTAYGIGWTRQVLKIWDGRAYPYQIGNNTGTTGFYKAEALQIIK